MLYTRKRKGLNIAELWFQTPQEFSAKKYAVCNYQNMTQPIIPLKGQFILNKRDAQTLISDLSLSDDELLFRCASNVRNEIRRAKKDEVVCTIYSSDDLVDMDALLQQFDDAYAEMHRQKDMAVVLVGDYLRMLVSTRALFLSIGKLGDEVVAYHVYVTGDGIARLLYSVSVFRDCAERTARNAIGRANRLLHYEDMLCFKKSGFCSYDWGGYATTPDLASINAFKDGFGGDLVPRYYAMISSYWLMYAFYRGFKKIRGKK